MARFLTVIGRAEKADFGGIQIDVPAKIDTGAYSSAIWATDIKEKDGELSFVLFGKGSPFYTGEVRTTRKFSIVTIENSFGHVEMRFGVEIGLSLGGKKFKAFFTLADRSKKIYPVLVGRKLLKSRFIVDVSRGHPIADEELEENGSEKYKEQLRKKGS
jgi:hypothetical protein